MGQPRFLSLPGGANETLLSITGRAVTPAPKVHVVMEVTLSLHWFQVSDAMLFNRKAFVMKTKQ